MNKMHKYILTIFKTVYVNFLYIIGNLIFPISFLKPKFYNLLHPDFNFSKGVRLRKNITFYAGGEQKGKLYIGENSFINEECFIDYSSQVNIGKNVAIGMKTLILSSSHKIGTEIRCGVTVKKTTTIEDNCWIGAGVIIYPGVTLSKGSIVAAGEVVRKNVGVNKLLKNGIEVEITKKEGDG
jgi:acetyltransferase-like isoleucine patch superfamily enzyme